jgi:hypothetical protein
MERFFKDASAADRRDTFQSQTSGSSLDYDYDKVQVDKLPT